MFAFSLFLILASFALVHIVVAVRNRRIPGAPKAYTGVVMPVMTLFLAACPLVIQSMLAVEPNVDSYGAKSLALTYPSFCFFAVLGGIVESWHMVAAISFSKNPSLYMSEDEPTNG